MTFDKAYSDANCADEISVGIILKQVWDDEVQETISDYDQTIQGGYDDTVIDDDVENMPIKYEDNVLTFTPTSSDKALLYVFAIRLYYAGESKKTLYLDSDDHHHFSVSD